MATRRRVALNTGGSIVAPAVIDPDFLRRLAQVLIKASDDRDLFVVVGGGRTARVYIEAGRAIGADEETLDRIGIEATRLNARLLIAGLGERVFPHVPGSVGEALDAIEANPIVVMGGTRPGQTTDAVSAMLADEAGADELIILTNVDGVYTEDPGANPDADRLPEITSARLQEIVGSDQYEAGSKTVVDPVAAGIIHRAGITTKVLDGRDLEQVTAALAGEAFHGTIVTPDA